MVNIVEVVKFETTPSELRKIADNLDVLWAKARLGEGVPKWIVYGLGNLELHFVIDQEEKYRQEAIVKRDH